nr:siphovirus Gp157 family protein [Oscillospiraceae bacterium]
MTLYEIDEALLNLVDPETGEIMDISAFTELQMDREKKLEGIACWIKDLYAEEDALKNEEDALRARRAAARRKRENLWAYLQTMLAGEKLKTGKVAVTYRKNPPSVQVDNEAELLEWARSCCRADLLRLKDPELDKAGLKAAIEKGEYVPGARIVQETRMVIQ